MPEWIHDLSCWLFHQEASAEWWTVGVTLFAVGAAVWAGLAAYEQLETLKTQIRNEAEAASNQLSEMEAARKDSLLPWVIGVEGERWSAGYTVIQVRNVGPGPALNC